MLCAVVLWFLCFNRVITSDKFVYLFGRVIPALSLVLSMTLRFVPLFRRQLETVRQAQFCIGRDASTGSAWQRARRAVTIFSIMVTWALENAIETADSMKSRGYGLRGRTAFSIYRMEDRDKYALGWLGFCGMYLLCGSLAGGLKWWYFPMLQGAMAQPFSISFYLAYLALCLTPVIIDRKEAGAVGDAFSRYHPLVNFLFFALVLAYSMVLMHPVCLAVSLLGALLYAGQLEGRRALARHLRVALPVLLLAALVNPAFNHAGVTILIYLPSGNPLTLESILYGLSLIHI